MKTLWFSWIAALLVLTAWGDDPRPERGAPNHAAGETEEAGSQPQAPKIGVQISPFIRRIYQDRLGNLWLGTNSDGVARYDGQALTYFNQDKGFAGAAVRAILEDDDGQLWFGTSSGVTKYVNGTFTNYTEEDGLNSHDVWSLCFDSSGDLWVGTREGACRFDKDLSRFVPFELPVASTLDPRRGVTSLKVVRSIISDRAGHLWFAVGTGGVHRYDGTEFKTYTERDGLSNGSVNCILEDRAGRLWFATHHNGICRFDGTSFTHFDEADGVKGIEAWDLFEDRDGKIWFPTEGHGVYCYDGKTFRNFTTEDGLASHAIQDTFQDKDGRLWVGGWLGLYRLDGDTFVNVTMAGPWH